MGLVIAYPKTEAVVLVFAEELDCLVGKVGSFAICVQQSDGQAICVEPYPCRVFERLPDRLYLGACRQRLRRMLFEILLMVRLVEAEVKTVLEVAVEVHLANRARGKSLSLQMLCNRDLILRQWSLQNGDADSVR